MDNMATGLRRPRQESVSIAHPVPPSQLGYPMDLRCYRIYTFDTVRAIFILFNLAQHNHLEPTSPHPHTYYREETRAILTNRALQWPLTLLNASPLQTHIAGLYTLAMPLLQLLPTVLSDCLAYYLHPSDVGTPIWDNQIQTTDFGMQMNPSIIYIISPPQLPLDTRQSLMNFEALVEAIQFKSALYPKAEERNVSWWMHWDIITTYGGKIGRSNPEKGQFRGERSPDLPVVVSWGGIGGLGKEMPGWVTANRPNSKSEDREIANRKNGDGQQCLETDSADKELSYLIGRFGFEEDHVEESTS